MGQAKKRGTLEERRAAALKRDGKDLKAEMIQVRKHSSVGMTEAMAVGIIGLAAFFGERKHR